MPACARSRPGELVRVARMLIEVDATAKLSPFLIRLADLAESPAEVGLIAELAAASERPHLVTQVGRFAAYYGQVNDAAAFPIPELAGLVRAAARRAGGGAAARRRGRRARSIPGSRATPARRPRQLIPPTARLMARALGLPYNEGLLTGDPDYNVRLGSHYLKTLLARYRGETALAVAAYNAGPSRVDEWLQLHGDPRRATATT